MGTDTAAIDGEAEQDQGPEEAEGLQPELAVKIADDQEPEAKKRKVIDGVLPSTVRSRTYNAHPRVGSHAPGMVHYQWHFTLECIFC